MIVAAMADRVPVILSPRAQRERDSCVEYLIEHHAYDAALHFLDRLDQTLAMISQMPRSGRVYAVVADRSVHKVNIRDFPERVFYTWDGESAYVTCIVSLQRNLLPQDLV